MSVGRFLQQGAAGNAGEAVYVEDVFSTYLYEGNSTSRTITNGIDLNGEGGLVWIKWRSGTNPVGHLLYTTDLGAGNYLSSNSTASLNTGNSTQLNAFNSDGFSLGNSTEVNYSGNDYASWTFRKQPGFFDVVTYTGNSDADQVVSHNLGTVPGFIIVKNITTAGKEWSVFHRSINNERYGFGILNQTLAFFTSTSYDWNPTETTFTADGQIPINDDGETYVAYLFAHDAQDFGTDSDESIIKCGSLTTTTNGDYRVELGFEPQWLLVKRSAGGGSSWLILDTMRGMPVGGNDAFLVANASDAELNSFNQAEPDATGFTLKGITGSSTYIYVAIRRPHKPASKFAATDLFAVDGDRDGGNTAGAYSSGFPVDMAIQRQENTTDDWDISSRLTQGKRLVTNATSAEVSDTDMQFDYQAGWSAFAFGGSSLISWMFRRAPGFFDVVAYTGTGSLQNVTHNLNVAPEMLVVKTRSTTGNWMTYHSGFNGGTNPEGYYAIINGTNAQLTDSSGAVWNNTAPTSSQFTVKTASYVNGAGTTYVAYLFATVPGISKVGSYTGTGSAIDVDCGFTSGARFVLIKRTDSAASWYLFDTVRGIVAGNDPMLNLISTSAQFTGADYIDPLSSGFTVGTGGGSELNASGGTYIFLAIA